MFDQVFPILFFVAVAAVIGLVVIWGIRQERKRTEALKQAAEGFGFEFAPGGDPVLQSWLDKFHLFSQGRARTMSNVLRGRTRDLDVAVFDYKFTVGHGKHARTHQTSVICFRADDLNLPAFCLRPESFWHRIGESLFGGHDIDFESHPAFSKGYLLKGKDEAAIRGLFADDVLDHYEATPGVSTEADGDVLVFYRHSARIDPAKVRGFMEEGFAVLGLFRRPAEPAA